MTYYINQNVDLFWMAVDEFGVKYADIDRIDRKVEKGASHERQGSRHAR